MTKTLSHITKVALLAVIMLAAHVDAFAQIKHVTGFVFDQAQLLQEQKKVPVDVSAAELNIYAYNNEKAAQEDYDRVMDELDRGDEGLIMYPDAETQADIRARFEIEVALSGALIIRYGLSKPKLVPVNGQLDLEIPINVGQNLGEVTVTVKGKGIGKVDLMPPVQLGNTINIPQIGFVMNDDEIKDNARMTIMPYVINRSQDNKIEHYRKPLVYDGREFHRTQHRWTNFDENNDSLAAYVQDSAFAKGRNIYMWSDTVIVPNDKESFQVVADIVVEDYLGITYVEKGFEVSSKNPRRPMRFLEYTTNGYELDPKDYEERPHRQIREDSTDMALTFPVGQAEIDYTDPNNEKELDKLMNELKIYFEDPDMRFTGLTFSSLSSPDGNLASNKALAQRRLTYARHEITKRFPAGTLDMTYIDAHDAQVATWEDVAKLLEADSLINEAQSVRDIIAKYPSQDAQSARMRGLACYDTIRIGYLPKLRRMRCSWKTERRRALSPSEVVALYESDKSNYRSGRKTLEPYEYWVLFQTLKDSTELEDIYKAAYEDSKTWNNMGLPWMLAANNLAVSYIRRDTADLSILEPFLNDTLKLNIKRQGGQIEINNETLVANQAIMYMKKDGQYAKASFLVEKLRMFTKRRYTSLINTILCLGGYYAVSDEIFNYMKDETTPLNKVILCLAKGGRQYAREALYALEEMPDLYTNPKLQYLKAIVHSRFGTEEFDKASSSLTACFNLGYQNNDKSWVELAKGDGDIEEELFEQAYYMSNYGFEDIMQDTPQ